MLVGKAKRDCTTPMHGLVESAEVKNFDLRFWDVKSFPFLKHFDEINIFEEEEALPLSDPSDISIF